MKFFLSLALFAAAGVSAQTIVTPAIPSPTSDCAADYIVTRCLETENSKVKDCNGADYTCLCASYQALLTCYNNCPDDTRAAPAKNQADSYCRAASLLATTSTVSRATGTPTQASTTPANSDGSSATKTSPASTSTGLSDGKKNAAAGLVNNAGSVFLALAGAIAALL